MVTISETATIFILGFIHQLPGHVLRGQLQTENSWTGMERTPRGSFLRISIHSSLLSSCLNRLIFRNITESSCKFQNAICGLYYIITAH